MGQSVVSHYSLGFSSPRAEPGTWRSLEVKVRRRGVRVTHRKGRYELDPFDVLAQQLTVPAGIRQGSGAFPVHLDAVEEPVEDGLRITGTATVSLAHLTFVPRGERAVATVGLLASLSTPDGRFETLQRNVQRLELPVEALERLEETQVRLALAFDGPAGDHTLTLAVFDVPSGTWGLATAPLRRGVPPPPGLVGELPVGRVIPAGLSPSESPPEPAPEEAPAGSPAPPGPDDARSRELQRALSWIEGPARWLLTPAERAGILASRTPEEVQEQIRLFWARRDPDPRAPGNPAREAFLERVAAADALLGEPGLAGSLTERGRVLILLGKPRNRRRSADLQVDTWFYDRTAVAAVAHRVHVPPVLQFQFRRDPEGRFHLADVNPAKQEAALRILETLPGASIRNPHLVSAPIPPLFDGFPAATGEELELLASGLETWPGDAVAVAYPEAFPGRPRRCLAVLRLPPRLPRASGAVGLVLDRNRRIAGSFRIPLEGRDSPWGVTYQLSIPVPDDDATLEILLVDGERPVAGTRVPLALEAAPPGAARLLPIITGAGLERREHFPPWSTNLFGGNRLEVRPEGRFQAGEDLYFFFVALNPPQPPGGPPAADVEVAVLRDGEPVARGRWEGVDLSMMAPGTFLFGSSFPVASIGEVGRYTLRFRVELHGSEVARVMTLPLVISTP